MCERKRKGVCMPEDGRRQATAAPEQYVHVCMYVPMTVRTCENARVIYCARAVKVHTSGRHIHTYIASEDQGSRRTWRDVLRTTSEPRFRKRKVKGYIARNRRDRNDRKRARGTVWGSIGLHGRSVVIVFRFLSFPQPPATVSPRRKTMQQGTEASMHCLISVTVFSRSRSLKDDAAGNLGYQ